MKKFLAVFFLILGIILLIGTFQAFSVLSGDDSDDDFKTEGYDEYYTNTFDEMYRIRYFKYVNRDAYRAGYEKINIYADDICIFAADKEKSEKITEVFKANCRGTIDIYVIRNNYGREILAWRDENGIKQSFDISNIESNPAGIDTDCISEFLSDEIDSVKQRYADMGLSDENITEFLIRE